MSLIAIQIGFVSSNLYLQKKNPKKSIVLVSVIISFFY